MRERLQRYNLDCYYEEHYDEFEYYMREEDNGDFVRYSDVEEYIRIVNFYLPHVIGKFDKEPERV